MIVAAFAAASLAASFVAFEAAIAVVPNRTPEGYGLMPIGQLGFSLLVGPVVGAFAAVFVARRLQR